MADAILQFYFYFGTIVGLGFLVWLIYMSPRVREEGKIRDSAIITGIIFLVFLIIPDIWALTRLKGVSWHVAWAVGLLFAHIIEAGIWHRICWGDKCPKCGVWVRVEDEPVPDSPNMVRRTKTCPKCGWTDSWAVSIAKAKKKERKEGWK